MISISFGFESVSFPDTIGEAVRRCLKEDILVFASASNDGGEGSRTHPARISSVICAHSATYNGRRSEFNPGTQQTHNFSFVGEHVRPLWGLRSETATMNTGITYKSGTSYATPVAVCVAAFMIGYIEKKMPNYPWVIQPCSPEGITQIFQMMAVKMDVYDWVSPIRFFKHTMEEKIQADLKQQLGPFQVI